VGVRIVTATVAILDLHPIARAGFEAVVRAQPDLAFAGSAAGVRELQPILYRARPDVVLVDRLGPCMWLRAKLLAPRVILCATDPRTELIVPAALAGVDAIVDRAADLRELLHAIRTVARGESIVPRITPRLQSRAGARLGTQDRAIFAMTLSGTSRTDIARVTGLGPGELESRLAAIVARLATPAAREEVLAA
jgi:DNA-binding NarL/FixJ family response regulator